MGTVKKSDNAQRGFFDNASDYFRGVWSEIKKVYWPSRQQVLTYTSVVFIAVIIISILLWLVDSGLGMILKKIMS